MKLLRKVISVIVCVVIIFSSVAFCVSATASGFAGGNGTEESPYLISTPQHFSNIRNYPSAYFMLSSDIIFTEADFAPGGDFYNNDCGFIPINNFSGTLDGNGYTVSGIMTYYEYTTSNTSYTVNVGLIRNNSGNIQNLFIENLELVAYADCSANLGGLVGKNTGNITNCSVSGSIISLCGDGSYVGGIAGANEKEIYHCYNSTFIYIYPTGDSAYSGGIAGITAKDSVIAYSYNLGVVSGYVTGGIAAVSNGAQIVTCGNAGFVGYTSVLRELSADLGILYCSSSGGIVGYGAGNTLIGGCYNAGEVAAYSDTYEAYAGGIAAELNESGITDCYNTGEILSCTSKYDAHSDKGAYSGGIAASVNSYASVEEENMSVENCYSVVAPTSNTPDLIGGVIGCQSGGIYKNNYYLNNASRGIAKNFDTTNITGISVLTDEAMQKAESFEGFDFKNLWWISSTSGYAYPQLHFASVAGAQSVEILSQPNSTEFSTGGEPDLSGGKMKVTYYSGQSEELDTGKLTVIGYDNTVLGEQNVYFVYAGYMIEGKVTVIKNTLKGDCDGNAQIDTRDLALLKLYLAGQIPENFDEEAADVDCDSFIKTSDLAMMKINLTNS
ncbi:MAG: dockerin type I repeat-containing protein [Acutalibacteraceae bacterium]|nr:dockerin type I repeat-containing protein [Acutalibacteraceae bacterium]